MPNNAVTATIPHDNEAEQAVLGSILYDEETFPEIASVLQPESFFLPAHQYIFQAMIDLEENGQPINDEVLIGDQLKSKKQLEDAGGFTYLGGLVDCSPEVAHIKHYIKIVEEHALLRDLISTTTEIARKSRNPEQNITELLSDAESKISEIATRTAKENYRHIKDIIVDSFTHLEKISATSSDVTGLATGFVDLDKLTSGLQPADLLILAARPSVGKTALALNIAHYVATKVNTDGAVLIFSMEMSKEQLALRLLGAEARVDGSRIKSGNLIQDDWDRLALATDQLSKTTLYINDQTNLSPFELATICKQLNKESDNGISLIVVDYLQLMKGNKPNQPREQEIAEISRSMKGLAKDLNVPVLALSQLNRALESRSDKHPQLSDLRESGSIEQDADIIMFIYRDEIYNPNSPDKGTAELIVAKHRNGALGKIRLAFIGKYTKFANFSDKAPYEE